MPCTKPNILLILTDDLGYDDLGLNGNVHAITPHLDNLGRQSVQFGKFTVNPVCAPSRATLMTGRHFLRTGVSHVHGGKDFLHLEERTLAQALKADGYVTGMWGKWHLGRAPGYYPWQRGFDEAYMADLYKHRNPSGMLNGRKVAHDGWSDAVIVDYAIDFIRRNRAQPWFAYVPSMTPHGKHAAPTEYVERFRKKGLSEPLAKINAMITHLDAQVGRLLAAIEKEGLADSTVVLFMSDNGPNCDLELSDSDRALRNVSGRRGWKGDIWENGVKSPLFIRQGGRFAPAVANACVEMADIFPTILELAGVQSPSDWAALDGRSFVSCLIDAVCADHRSIFNYSNPGWPPNPNMPYNPDGIRNEYNPVAPNERRLLRAGDQVISVRRGPWKLLMNPQINDDSPEKQTVWLVNLDDDHGERQNLAAVNPQLVRELRAQLEKWWQSILDEEHSFTAPQYVFPCGDAPDLHIPAKNTFCCSPALRNTVTCLKQWSEPGQFAKYHLRATGGLAVKIRFARAMSVESQWKLSAADSTATVILPAGCTETDFPVLEPSQNAGSLRLELIGIDGQVSPQDGAWLDTLIIAAANENR